ncbi:MAG: hypothetical protein KME29_16365 [Calothrix sp. FI2-JRJ7]|jgi:hypothetical protein|nr:hypothetical protein [Calothrix sp. FI2-JRJ7]
MNTPQPGAQFLTVEDSGKVDAALLSSPEKFLARITLSSHKLLIHIAKEHGIPVEELTTQQIIAWFEKDGKIRREQGIEAAYLQW